MFPCENDSENEGSKSSQLTDSEKEVNLRVSKDYEIHTITEESEQVTQTEIRSMTPRMISSKQITPNKRYSGTNLFGVQNNNPSKVLNFFLSSEIEDQVSSNVKVNSGCEYLSKRSVAQPKEVCLQLYQQQTNGMEDHNDQIQNREEANTPTDSQLKMLVKSKSCMLDNSQKLPVQKATLPKRRIQKGKLLKIKSPKKNSFKKFSKVAIKKSKGKVQSSGDNQYSQHLSTAKQLCNKNSKKVKKSPTNFLRRMEMDRKMRSQRDISNDTNRKTPEQKVARKHKISMNTIKLFKQSSRVPEYQFDTNLKSNSFIKASSQIAMTDCINMITFESNQNELLHSDRITGFTKQQPAVPNHKQSTLFDYNNNCSNNKYIKNRPKLDKIGKSASALNFSSKNMTPIT